MSSYLFTTRQVQSFHSQARKPAPCRNEGPPELPLKVTGYSITSQFPESRRQPHSISQEAKEQSFVDDRPGNITGVAPTESDPLLLGLQLTPRCQLLQPLRKASAQVALTLPGHSTSYFFNSLDIPSVF